MRTRINFARVAGLVFFMVLSGCFALAQTGQPDAAALHAIAESPALPLVHYRLDLTQPGSHLADVSMVVPTHDRSTTLFIPAWYPGRYSIYNFGANVQQTQAFCDESGAPSAIAQPLPFHRLGPSSWRVQNGSCKQFLWEYRVFGNHPLNGTFFQLDLAHASINGGPVFMYVGGEKPDPVELDLVLPKGWHVLDELGRPDQTHLWFPNYDVFIDAPIEAGANYTIDSLHLDGRTYRVLIQDFVTPRQDSAHKADLLTALRKIITSENQIVGPDDLDTYTFFFHFDRQSVDGMEHLFGTQIMVPEGLATGAGLKAAEVSAAHEFFHQWNVKRIRPVALGPFNYQAPNPTPSLWVAEGFTQYYQDLTLERTGLQSKRDFLGLLGNLMGQARTLPNDRLTSAEDASLTAWFHDATPLLQETNGRVTVVSYYYRGEELAAVLDLDLRRRTGDKKSLNDVLRWLWNHTYRAPRANYYLPGRGYTETDVRHAIEAVAGGTSYAQFFADYVSATKPVPFNRYLAAAGLRLDCQVPSGITSYSGLQMDGNDIRAVDPDSPAGFAGAGRDAIVVSVNGHKTGSDAESVIDRLEPNRPARLVIEEHGVDAAITFTPVPPRTGECTVGNLAHVTAAQRSLRSAWLGSGPEAYN